MTLAFGFALLYTIRRMSIPELGSVHPTLRTLALILPLLVIRGAWGITQAVNLSQSFASPDAYGRTGLRGEFVAKEYALATLVRSHAIARADPCRWSGCPPCCSSRPGVPPATTTPSHSSTARKARPRTTLRLSSSIPSRVDNRPDLSCRCDAPVCSSPLPRRLIASSSGL